MTKGNQKLLCEENLRHAEYYSMLSVFDDLYEKSKSGVVFEDLMSLILKRENILLAYRNIKTNTGSKTAGTDQLTIGDIGKLSPDEVVNNVRYYIQGTVHGYHRANHGVTGVLPARLVSKQGVISGMVTGW